MWSIWNEPNQPQFLQAAVPQAASRYSPKLYRKLYQAAYNGLRATPANAQGHDPDRRDLAARQRPTSCTRCAFLRGMLCLDSEYRKAKSCGKLEADGYAHHAYTTRAGPRFVPPNKRRRDDRRAARG